MLLFIILQADSAHTFCIRFTATISSTSSIGHKTIAKFDLPEHSVNTLHSCDAYALKISDLCNSHIKCKVAFGISKVLYLGSLWYKLRQ